MTTVEGWRALVVPVAGPLRDVVLSTERSGLTDLYQLVGPKCDYVERTRGPAHVDVWVDEEGAVIEPPRPVNPRLTQWAQRRDDWPLRGDAVITGPADESGEITSLAPEALALLRKAIGGEP